jgi:hypothetical protein
MFCEGTGRKSYIPGNRCRFRVGEWNTVPFLLEVFSDGPGALQVEGWRLDKVKADMQTVLSFTENTATPKHQRFSAKPWMRSEASSEPTTHIRSTLFNNGKRQGYDDLKPTNSMFVAR